MMTNHLICNLHPRLIGILFGGAMALLAAISPACAQPLSHPNPYLNSVYPSGAQQGQTVEVEFNSGGALGGATGIQIEGPPGITVSEVKPLDDYRATAKLTVAADAPLGRRMVRVVGGLSALTNSRSFLVGRLPEIQEPIGGDFPVVQNVTAPLVVNGRLDPAADVDRFQFAGRAGQSIVAAVLAHRIDVLKPHPQKDMGYLDVGLELLNDQGVILAAAADTLGLDPVLHYTLPADGNYTVVAKGLGYQGFPGAVYRMTLGEVPYPTSIFPAGGKRGETVDVEVFGFNIAPNTRIKVQVPSDEFPLLDVLVPGLSEGNCFLPFFCGNDTEVLETSEPHLRDHAQPLSSPGTVNGRFLAPGEEDWYEVELKAQANVAIEVLADRHLRSPVDSFVEVYDASGKKLGENDDGALWANECIHDYNSADSWLAFTAPADGKYFIRLVNEAAQSGNGAVYRLSIRPLEPDFTLYQWPDAVPIWGAGNTSAFIVQELHRGGFTGDIELRVEGLPAGWTALPNRMETKAFAQWNNLGMGIKVLMTITAPADAPRGTVVPFRVVGKAVINGKTVEHAAQALTMLGGSHSDRMHLRFSRGSFAAVGPELDCRLEVAVKEISGRAGETVQIPVKIYRAANAAKETGLSVDGGSMVHAATSIQPPTPIAADQSEILFALRIGMERAPGDYGIVISRSWASDLRHARPGPCTPLVMLHVLPQEPVPAK
jgi:hypothetical protein